MQFQLTGSIALWIASLAFTNPDAIQSAHWKLQDPHAEKAAGTLHATLVDVHSSETAAALATQFNGESSRITIDPNAVPPLGKNDFTISAWVEVHPDNDTPGDILSRFDPATRSGFSLSIVTRQGVTHSQANLAQLQFGIDNGADPVWTDRGRPGQAIYIHALAVFDSNLYAATCEPARDQVGHVHRLEQPDRWVDCGSPDNSNAVISLAEFDGHLYAGTGRYRTGGSALPDSENTNRGGRIFKYQGDHNWTLVADFPDVEAIGAMLPFQSQILASTLYRPAALFQIQPDGSYLPFQLPPGGKRVESMIQHNQTIFATSYDNGNVYALAPAKSPPPNQSRGANEVTDMTQMQWNDTGPLGDNTQCYAFAIYRDHLYTSTWPSGKVYRWQDQTWVDTGQLGDELEVMGMAVHNGNLYAGTLPDAQVYRYDGDSNWTATGQLDKTPNVKYRRAWTMAVFQGQLFVGTLPSGHVYSMQTGPCVTLDRAFPIGWHHITAQRDGNRLLLFLDGQLVAESEPFDPAAYDITSQAPLHIGAGPNDPFHGQLRDIRIDTTAIPHDEIRNRADRKHLHDHSPAPN